MYRNSHHTLHFTWLKSKGRVYQNTGCVAKGRVSQLIQPLPKISQTEQKTTLDKPDGSNDFNEKSYSIILASNTTSAKQYRISSDNCLLYHDK